MKVHVKVVSGRLDANLGKWWAEREEKTGKSTSEVLRELVLWRIAFEANPWLEVARLNEEKNRQKVEDGTAKTFGGLQ